MKFGILKDIKNGEYRVIATPVEVGTLVADGNEVLVCSGAEKLDPAPPATFTRSDHYYPEFGL